MGFYMTPEVVKSPSCLPSPLSEQEWKNPKSLPFFKHSLTSVPIQIKLTTLKKNAHVITPVPLV